MFCCSSPIFQASFPGEIHIFQGQICSPTRFLPVLQAKESRATSHVQHGERLLGGSSQRIQWGFQHFSMVKLSLTEWIYDL